MRLPQSQLLRIMLPQIFFHLLPKSLFDLGGCGLLPESGFVPHCRPETSLWSPHCRFPAIALVVLSEPVLPTCEHVAAVPAQNVVAQRFGHGGEHVALRRALLLAALQRLGVAARHYGIMRMGPSWLAMGSYRMTNKPWAPGRFITLGY